MVIGVIGATGATWTATTLSAVEQTLRESDRGIVIVSPTVGADEPWTPTRIPEQFPITPTGLFEDLSFLIEEYEDFMVEMEKIYYTVPKTLGRVLRGVVKPPMRLCRRSLHPG